MKHYLLRLLKDNEGIYEHKFCSNLGKPYLNFPELEELIVSGFVERFEKQEGFIVKGLRLTDSGEAELTTLDAIPVAPPVPNPEQLRRTELVRKLKDDTITSVEVRELLRMVIRF